MRSVTTAGQNADHLSCSVKISKLMGVWSGCPQWWPHSLILKERVSRPSSPFHLPFPGYTADKSSNMTWMWPDALDCDISPTGLLWHHLAESDRRVCLNGVFSLHIASACCPLSHFPFYFHTLLSVIIWESQTERVFSLCKRSIHFIAMNWCKV